MKVQWPTSVPAKKIKWLSGRYNNLRTLSVVALKECVNFVCRNVKVYGNIVCPEGKTVCIDCLSGRKWLCE